VTSVAVLVVYVAMLGLVLGSFANVVIHRVPLGLSLVTPASRCPHCEHAIRYRENIPVVSWVALRGRCAHCRAAIGLRYPLVELGVCLLFVAVTVRMHSLDLLAALPAFLYFALVAVVLALIDLDSRRLPDVIVLPSYGVLLALLAVTSVWRSDWSDLERAAAGGLVLFAFFFAITLVYPGGMGFGDVKLAGLTGAVSAYLSWGCLVVGAFTGFLLGAVVGVAMIATGRAGRKTSLPFGPFLVVGAFVAIFAGDWITNAYLHLGSRG
jgi:leader peptidase (prepilin peptidase)/N-methyltransferase